MREKVALKEEIVKFIFPGAKPEIALGEDGYIVYDFKRLYPEKLGIFVPIEIEKSGYSNVFPRSFEDYFLNVHTEVGYLSRLLETEIKTILWNIDFEYIPGRMLNRDENNYTIFRFDELMGITPRTDLLCRIEKARLSAADEMDIIGVDPYFIAEAVGISGIEYFYFIIPIDKLLFNPTNTCRGIIASVFSYARANRKNGPL